MTGAGNGRGDRPDTSGLAELLAAVGRGYEGDADEAAEAFADDAELTDLPGTEPLRGRGEILGHFLAFGGRRERFALGDVVADGDRAAVEFTVAFRADAHAYAQHGIALVTLRDGRIGSWRGVWVETEEDLSAWSGD